MYASYFHPDLDMSPLQLYPEIAPHPFTTHHELHGDVVLIAGAVHLHAGADGHRRHRHHPTQQVLGAAPNVQHVQVFREDALKQRQRTQRVQVVRNPGEGDTAGEGGVSVEA
jgi:uncharacterized protein YjlB